jgi:multidrug resistance protein MdtO
MFCYILYSAIDWSGIHTAFITCTFIALESTEATLYKGTLRFVGCLIGGALALFSIVFLMPHMETIASLVVLVACASAIAGWVATGSERISYAGLQIAFAFFYSVFQGYAPDTDLDNVRNRVIGILFGLIVTGLVFRYIWPERTIDRLRDALRAALQQLARLLEIPDLDSSIETARSEANNLIAETSKSFEQARRYADLTGFELRESPNDERASLGNLESTLSRTENAFAAASSLFGDEALAAWQHLPADLQMRESALRTAAANRIEQAMASVASQNRDADFVVAFSRWKQGVMQLKETNIRTARVSEMVTEVQQLKSTPD